VRCLVVLAAILLSACGARDDRTEIVVQRFFGECGAVYGQSIDVAKAETECGILTTTINRFEAENPDVRVKINVVAWPGYPQLAALTARFALDDRPCTDRALLTLPGVVSCDQFTFAVVSDRTGGHREKVFSRAVQQINWLQPQFVMSVGDLIEGYTTKEETIKAEWDEFDGYVKRFEMPFFYVPGNHDLTNKTMVTKWGERYGKKYYHFTYRGALFLCLCSENPPDMGTIDKEQQE